MKKRKVIKRLSMGAVCFGVLSGMHSVAEASSLDGYNRTRVADQNYRQLHGTTAMPEAGNDPELAAFCFGDTYTRGTLDYKMREMVTMAVIGTMGGADPQFKSHVAGTLNSGATKEEVIGVITTMNPYIGFPRTLNCLRIANEVFSEQK